MSVYESKPTVTGLQATLHKKHQKRRGFGEASF